MVRLDMSEYGDGTVGIEKLIGMPRGIVGSERGGILTEQLRENPYTVLLLDEVEKASPYLMNIFLQAFDEGWLTDGRGRRVYLSDAIVIMTSNLGSDSFKKFEKPLGFGTKTAQDFRVVKNEVMKAAEGRRVAYINRKNETARLADIQNVQYESKVYITFDHYGDMTPILEQRIAESSEPVKSKARKSALDSDAVWLRLHNDSRLPISVPTQSMYLPNPKCFHAFSDGEKLFGLCDNREISIWTGLEDKDGKQLPFGLDFGSSVILLPHSSALFAVSRAVLNNGNAITISFTFQNLLQKPIDGNKIGDYGTDKILRFRELDLPKL